MENKAALEKKIKLKKLHISITNTVMQQKKNKIRMQYLIEKFQWQSQVYKKKNLLVMSNFV